LSAGNGGQGYDFGEVEPDALQVAGALGLIDGSGLSRAAAPDAGVLIAAQLITDGTPFGHAKVGVAQRALNGFPTGGNAYVYLGTGNMLFADQGNSAPNTFGLGLGAGVVLTLSVPNTATCNASGSTSPKS
jgi:hypothetical protein